MSDGMEQFTFEQLEIEKFPTEKQPIEIASWVLGMITAFSKLDPIDEKNQLFVVTELNKLIDHVQGKDPKVLGSKAIRSDISKAYELAFSSGHKRQLYETANKFLNIHAGYRYAFLKTLQSVIATTGDSFDDSLSKDTWKNTKGITVDKSAKASAASFEVLEALVTTRIVFKNHSDFESFRSIYLKAMESTHAVVRQAAAKCMARAALQLTKLSETKAEIQAPQKGSKKKSEADDDEEDSGRSSAASAKANASSKAQFYSSTFPDVLSVFAACYLHPNGSTRLRVGVTQTIAFFVLMCDAKKIEQSYSLLSSTLFSTILGHSSIKADKYKSLSAKKHMVFVLNDIVASQILGEYGQTDALKVLINDFVAKYDQKQATPVKETLVAALETITGLIGFLGSEISGVVGSLKPCLLQLLEHPSYSVRTACCMCFKALLMSCPSNIIPLLTASLNHITKELPLMSKKESNSTKILGHAYLASVIVSLTNAKPEHSSLDLTSRVLTTATSLLKNSGNVDVLTVQTQVAWLLVSGLMPLGPNFVKVHLSQLLLLWKSALHKPVGKDQSDKSTLELNYHLHVRYCALSCIVSFLKFNHKLVTADVGRRLGVMLQNTTTFLSSIPSKKYQDDDPSHQLDKSLTLQDYDLMVKKRILQAYLYLSRHSNAAESFPANVLTSALATFADSDKSMSKMSSSIAASSGTLDSIWELADNSAFGVTSKVGGFDILDRTPDARSRGDNMFFDDQARHWISESSWCGTLEKQVMTPILGSLEFDPMFLLEESPDRSTESPVPIATSVVDLSIELFAVILPTQTAKVVESILDQLRTYASSCINQSQKKTDHKTAVAVNSVVTIHTALKFAHSPKNSYKDSLKNLKVIKIFVDVIKKALADSDPYVRNMAAQSMGMLCSLGGSTTTTEHIKYLIDEIVANRDPNARGGCSIALGYILKYVGGMFAGLHLKTILSILVSLASDPHPTVHFWALEAIAITIESSGLSFANYMSSTLSTLNKLYLSESHSDEVSSSTSGNMELEFPTTRALARCVKALINVLGPDLRESSKSRNIVFSLVKQFEMSSDENVVVESHRSIQELIIFAPEEVNLTTFSREVCKNLTLPSMSPLRAAAIDGVYQLIRTQSTKIFEYTGKELETLIWFAYNQTPNNRELKRFIENWLEVTGESEPYEWVARIQAVLLKSQRSFEPASLQKDSQATSSQKETDVSYEDEEGASFAANTGSGDSSGKEDDGENQIDEPLKWQTRALAVSLLRQLVRLLLNNRTKDERENSPLVRKVGDLIKLAFSASTASVVELRLLGLRLLNDILTELKDLVDPDFQEVALLEQYQAQIGSALTPSFSADSSPELAFQAIKVCATFIGSGIIKNVDRMGRILKLLTNALESCSGSHIHLGELNTPSPNAQVMLRIAILSLWAELQVSSVSPGKEYLVDVVGPYVPTLVPLWISALRDFAKLRFEPEQSSGLSSSGSSLSGSIDQMYSALSRTSVLPIYQESWLQLVDAIASLIEKDNKLVFEILDEKERAATEENKEGIKYSNEPAAFFFVLFGLCFEALVRPQQSTENRLKVLNALQRILHPSVSASAIYKDVVFAEMVDVLDRIVLTGNVQEQLAVVEIASSLCLNHPSGVRQESEDSENHITEGIEQLFELFRVVMLSLTNIFPFLADSDKPIPRHVTEDAAHLTLIRSCLNNLVSMIGVFPNIIKVDLYSCLLYVFGRLLEDEQCQKNIVPYSLGVQKKLLNMMVKTHSISKDASNVIEQAVIMSVCHIISLLKAADLSAPGLTKRKNCLLSCVVVLTASSDIIHSNTGFLHDLGRLLIENLNISEISTVTAECTRTLLASSVNNNVGRVVAEDVIPSLVSMATQQPQEGEETDKKCSMQSKLVNDILVGFTRSLRGVDKIVSGLSLTLPTLIQFIGDRTCSLTPEERLDYVKERLIELASFDSTAFKKVVQEGLSEWQRTLLERVLRGDGEATNQSDTNSESGTHIQLKSFG
ncbi:hypothetical protein TRICI_003904 [Trichomonascus ciferrii]|uniref:LAA1-like C-terminal TPR repeats domain-containing protein n=1 Tax=Trichomonascus ciferrii TaxID=44093 RepID=A0A642V2G3_9ASCO|nr:hypothetical protein TRICI_003904 [Trichomonascus ciferrii]